MITLGTIGYELYKNVMFKIMTDIDSDITN